MGTRIKQLEALLVIVAGLLAIYWTTKVPGWLAAAGLVAVTGAFWPRLTGLIYTAWMWLATWLGKLNGTVLLSAVFFVLLTPIAWLARRAGASQLVLRPKPPGDSYYLTRDHRYEPRDLENMW